MQKNDLDQCLPELEQDDLSSGRAWIGLGPDIPRQLNWLKTMRLNPFCDVTQLNLPLHWLRKRLNPLIPGIMRNLVMLSVGPTY